jgi:CPA2 family monovalent cation:H+ antiporter-2
MGEISSSIFLNVVIYLLIPFTFGFIFKRLNVSPIIGYIVAGLVLGNFFDHLVSKEIIDGFAYFGIILLLFTIGLEVNFERILVLKRFILTGGLIQVLASIFFVSIISHFFDFTFIQSLLIGIAMASSSTALVAKIIQERGEESSFTGELAIGILMFQDIAFIPFIIIFTYFHEQASSATEIVQNIVMGIGQAAVILGGMYYFGKKLIPLVFSKIVKTSRELLNLFIIIFIFLIGFLTTSFEVPILVGMYVAGVLVSQTAEHYHIFSQIRPIRDVLAIIFFIYIGTNIELSFVLPLLPKIALFSTAIILAKSFILLLIFLYFRFSSRLSFTLAVYLFQVSENGFILMSVAFQNKVFSQEQYMLVITSILTTLVMTPLIINSKEVIYGSIRGFFRKYIPAVETFISHKIDFDRSPIDVLDIKNHVVICGYGRVGSHIGRALMLSNIPFIAIDYNYHAVAQAKREGVPIIYGDPTDFDILDYAQVENAQVLVAVIPDKTTQEAIILNAKKLNREIYIISRVHKEEHQRRMIDLGAQAVVQPELEASMSIIKRLLLINNVPREEIVKKLRHFKVERGILG